MLEMYPQHATISSLMVDSKVQLCKVEVVENLGWVHLSQKIADYVVAKFLEQTRFSPFHEAENEKNLNNQLDGIFHQAKTAGSFQISISHDGTPYTARLKSSEISLGKSDIEFCLFLLSCRLNSGIGIVPNCVLSAYL